MPPVPPQYISTTGTMDTTPNIYLGSNTTITNNSATGSFQTKLPIKTDSHIDTKYGLNINPSGTDVSMSIDSTGKIETKGDVTIKDSLDATTFSVTSSTGAVAASGNLTINTDKFVVTSSSGAIEAKGDLKINTDKFVVTSSSGDISTEGSITGKKDLIIKDSNTFKVFSDSGNVKIGGHVDLTSYLSINSDNCLIADTGAITAKNSLTIKSGATQKFKVDHTSGSITAEGDVTIATNKFTVSATTGDVTQAGDLTIATDKFTVSATTGDVEQAGDLTVGGGIESINSILIGPISGTSDHNVVLNSTGAITSQGDLTLQNSGTTTFNVDSATGALTATGTSANLKINDGTADKFVVTASTGAVTSKGNFTLNDGTTNRYVVNSTTGAVIATGSSANLTINNGTADKFSVTASSGDITTSGDLTINTDKFKVTSSTGAVLIKGTSSELGVHDGTARTFTVSANGDINVNSNKLNITASSGSLKTKGDLTLNDGTTDNFKVINSTGAITTQGDLTIQSSGTDKFTVDSSTGDVNQAGDLKINTNKFVVTASSGDVTLGSTTTNGSVKTTFNNYTESASATNSTITSSEADPSFTSTTSQFLTTQEFVEKAIWRQTKRINTIINVSGVDVADKLDNLYRMAEQMQGNDAIQNLSGLLDTTEEIKLSLTDIIRRSEKTIPVNISSYTCSSSTANTVFPQPMPNSTEIGNYSGSGWWFQNLTTSSKIKWKISLTDRSVTVSDLVNLYLDAYMVSNLQFPKVTVYTQTGSSITYNYNALVANQSLTKKESYTLYTAIDNADDSTSLYTSKNIVAFTTSDAALTGTELIDYVLITSDTTTVNNIQFIVNTLNLQIKKKGTLKYTFDNGIVSNNYFFNNFYSKNIDFTALNAAQTSYLTAYNSEYNSS